MVLVNPLGGLPVNGDAALVVLVFLLLPFFAPGALLFYQPRLLRGGWRQSGAELLVRATGTFLVANATRARLRQLPLFLPLLLILGSYNLAGLFPFGFAVSAHFLCTLFFGGSIFFGLSYPGLVRYGFRYFNLFLPSGTPFGLLPLIVLLELLWDWPGLPPLDLAWWGLLLSDLAWWGNFESVGSFGELPNPLLGAMAWPGILGRNRPAGGAKAGQYPTLTEKPPSTPWSTGLVEDLMAQTPMGRIQAHHLGLVREGNKTLKRVVVEAHNTLPDPFWAAQEPLLAQARAMAKAAEKANLSGTKALEATLTREYRDCLRYFLDQVFLDQALQRGIAAEAAQREVYAHVQKFLVEAEAHAEHLRWRSHLGEYLLNPYVPWGFNGYEGDYLYVETCQVAQMEAERLYEAVDLGQETARLQCIGARAACRDSGRALSQADRTYWMEQAAHAVPENTPASTSEPHSVPWQDPLVPEDQNGNPLASAPAIPEEDPYRAYFPAGGSVETSSFQDFFMESASDPLLMLIRGTLAYFGLG